MPREALEIRKAVAGDAEQIWVLVRDFATSFRPERLAFGRTLVDLLDRTDTLINVAVTEPGTVVGYLLGSYHGTLFANGPVAWIEELMVSESFRRQGVATMLVASAEEWARSVPSAFIALASRRAGDLYQSIGYEESATYFRRVLVAPEG